MLGADAPCVSAWRSAAQEELAGAAAERERLAPQMEEARWRARQAERDAAEARAAAAAAQQVRPPRWHPTLLCFAMLDTLDDGHDIRFSQPQAAGIYMCFFPSFPCCVLGLPAVLCGVVTCTAPRGITADVVIELASRDCRLGFWLP